MLILTLGFWVASAVLLGVLFAACAWFEQRHPHALDWVLGPIHVKDLDREWAEWS